MYGTARLDILLPGPYGMSQTNERTERFQTGVSLGSEQIVGPNAGNERLQKCVYDKLQFE